MARCGGSGLRLLPAGAGWLQVQAVARSSHAWPLVNMLCNSPDRYFGVSKILSHFFIKENIAEGSSEGDGILKECFGKHFWDSRWEVFLTQDCRA